MTTAPPRADAEALHGVDESVNAPLPPAPEASEERTGLPSWARTTGRVVVAVVGALALFGLITALKGVNPFTAYADMFGSTFSSPSKIGEIFVRGTPIILAALAVAIPARAGLVNVGGEGQLVIGGVAAAGVALALPDLPGSVLLVLMIVAAMVAGALWAAVAALLRLWVNINESVTTLLMNYIAVDVMLFLIYDPWKDKAGSGQPATPALPVGARLSLLGSSRVHIGIIIALVITVIVALVLSRTSWGFRLGVVGGNAEAARRAGLRVGLLLVTAMAVGGALAGLGGLTQLAGTEFKLRPGFLLGYGYIGFLASWLARHKPLPVAGAALLLSAITIGGDSLQLDSKLPAATVNILMALVLLAVFGFSASRKAVRS
ncbi:MAG: ABC transporter permease [Acidimicrobiales bacterium]